MYKTVSSFLKIFAYVLFGLCILTYILVVVVPGDLLLLWVAFMWVLPTSVGLLLVSKILERFGNPNSIGVNNEVLPSQQPYSKQEWIVIFICVVVIIWFAFKWLHT
jgi:hypothetical protein